MKLLPIKWVANDPERPNHYTTTVMGVGLAVIPDTDGTFTASMTVKDKRPELQKLFSTPEQAKEYAETVLLQREIKQHFVQEPTTNELISEWFNTATPEPTTKDICVQMGAMFEEMAELSRAFGIRNEKLEETSAKFYQADHPNQVAERPIDRMELLDAMCDVQVTMQGVCAYTGMDYHGALAEVNRSNWSKFVDGKPVRNEQGKIAKGANYTPPDLWEFVDGKE